MNKPGNEIERWKKERYGRGESSERAKLISNENAKVKLWKGDEEKAQGQTDEVVHGSQWIVRHKTRNDWQFITG
jgi:hypothetical protein